MLNVTEGVVFVKTEKNAAVKNEIRETLTSMSPGTSFEIEGKIKKGTVAALAIAMNVKIKIGKDAAGKIWCTRLEIQE